MEIGLDFFKRCDTLQIARDLLGKTLFTNFGALTGGIITEVEGYLGSIDKACHAYKNRRTKRTEPMFGSGGIAYVYLCYGIHCLFNIVTHAENEPHAILIRAIKPTTGLDTIKARHGKTDASGPGLLTKALGITTKHTGITLNKPHIWLEDTGFTPDKIHTAKRIGIDYAEEDADQPWRFFIKG